MAGAQGREEPGVSEELKEGQCHLSLAWRVMAVKARMCKMPKPRWGARVLFQGKGK